MRFEGKIWKVGDNIDTDNITPGKHLYLPLPEMAKHALEVVDPNFAKQVTSGDLLVAGRNFGCGSSREQAPRVLKILGVACVVADSFARIFYRNAIAIGLPVLAVPGLAATTAANDVLLVDLAAGRVTNRRTGAEHMGRPIPERLLAVLREGGILPALKRIAIEQASA
jgi:3-isopropylmalate/(R)-2-methylmalate dehydratase small subunit